MPGRSWPYRPLLAVAAAALATTLPTDAGTGTLVDTDTASLPGDAGAAPGVRRRPGRRARRGRSAAAAADLEPGPAAAPRGLPLRQAAAGGEADPRALRRAGRTGPGRVRLRAGDLPQRGRDPDQPPADRMAAQVPPQQLREFALAVAAKYGITSAPSLGNPEFTAAVVFDLRRAAGTPKARLAYLFPNRHSAQIVLRLRPDLSDSERHRALELIREAVLETTPRAACKDGGIPAPCFAAEGRQLRRLRGAGRRRRPLAGAEGRPAGPARRRRRRDGARPRARLPLAPAAAAAGAWRSPPRRSPSASSAWSAAR